MTSKKDTDKMRRLMKGRTEIKQEISDESNKVRSKRMQGKIRARSKDQRKSLIKKVEIVDINLKT